MAGLGLAWSVRVCRGEARSVSSAETVGPTVWRGSRQGRQGTAWHVQAWPGQVWQGRQGGVGHG